MNTEEDRRLTIRDLFDIRDVVGNLGNKTTEVKERTRLITLANKISYFLDQEVKL